MIIHIRAIIYASTAEHLCTSPGLLHRAPNTPIRTLLSLTCGVMLNGPEPWRGARSTASDTAGAMFLFSITLPIPFCFAVTYLRIPALAKLNSSLEGI